MSDLVSLRAVVRGRVQGVYFRDFILGYATALGLTGYVRNLPGGAAVEVEVEGEKAKLEELINHLKVGPPHARVDAMDIEWSEYRGIHTDFSVRY